MEHLDTKEAYALLLKYMVNNPCKMGSKEYGKWNHGFLQAALGQGIERETSDPATIEGYDYATKLLTDKDE